MQSNTQRLHMLNTYLAEEFQSRPAKRLFEQGNAWDKVLWKHGKNFTKWQITSVERMLACGRTILGVKRYECANSQCTYHKHLCHSCKNKACSACGTKATEQWIANQIELLPECEWQHITFTVPSELWLIIKHNPHLLNQLFKTAGNYSEP